MNLIKTNEGQIGIGSGYLYAIEADHFSYDNNFDVEDMVEIGYISDSATFTSSQEMKAIDTANYETVAMIPGKTTSTFDTGIITYNVDNVARFLTGNSVVTADGKKTVYGASKKVRPEVALVFASDKTAKPNFLIMPKCVWVGDYTLNFNIDNPVEFNYNFRCLETTLPNGERGTYFEIYSVDDDSTEHDSTEPENP